MTLTTYLYVMDPIDPVEVFAKAVDLLGPRPDGQPIVIITNPLPTELVLDKYGWEERWAPGSLSIETGQRLPAWLELQHGANAPLRTEPEMGVDGEDMDRLTHPASWLDLMWDTTYSYRDNEGRDCTTLHAHYLREMGAWLDSRQIAWGWRDEYSGEVHAGVEGLTRFMHHGDQAQGTFDALISKLTTLMNEKPPTGNFLSRWRKLLWHWPFRVRTGNIVNIAPGDTWARR